MSNTSHSLSLSLFLSLSLSLSLSLFACPLVPSAESRWHGKDRFRCSHGWLHCRGSSYSHCQSHSSCRYEVFLLLFLLLLFCLLFLSVSVSLHPSFSDISSFCLFLYLWPSPFLFLSLPLFFYSPFFHYLYYGILLIFFFSFAMLWYSKRTLRRNRKFLFNIQLLEILEVRTCYTNELEREMIRFLQNRIKNFRFCEPFCFFLEFFYILLSIFIFYLLFIIILTTFYPPFIIFLSSFNPVYSN